MEPIEDNRKVSDEGVVQSTSWPGLVPLARHHPSRHAWIVVLILILPATGIAISLGSPR